MRPGHSVVSVKIYNCEPTEKEIKQVGDEGACRGGVLVRIVPRGLQYHVNGANRARGTRKTAPQRGTSESEQRSNKTLLKMFFQLIDSQFST